MSGSGTREIPTLQTERLRLRPHTAADFPACTTLWADASVTRFIGGRALANTDTAQLCALRTEVAAWSALMTAVREPIAVYCTPSAGGMHNLRLALRQRYPGEVRNAIAAVFASNADVKNVFVVDEDTGLKLMEACGASSLEELYGQSWRMIVPEAS